MKFNEKELSYSASLLVCWDSIYGTTISRAVKIPVEALRMGRFGGVRTTRRRQFAVVINEVI